MENSKALIQVPFDSSPYFGLLVTTQSYIVKTRLDGILTYTFTVAIRLHQLNFDLIYRKGKKYIDRVPNISL